MAVAVDIDAGIRPPFSLLRASTRNSSRRSRRARPPCQESTWRASSIHRPGRRVVVLAGACFPEPRPPCALKTTGPSCDAAVICNATVKNVFWSAVFCRRRAALGREQVRNRCHAVLVVVCSVVVEDECTTPTISSLPWTSPRTSDALCQWTTVTCVLGCSPRLLCRTRPYAVAAVLPFGLFLRARLTVGINSKIIE
jgi:hypothetical protein